MLNTGAAEVAQCSEGGDFEESDLIIMLLPSGQTRMDRRGKMIMYGQRTR